MSDRNSWRQSPVSRWAVLALVAIPGTSQAIALAAEPPVQIQSVEAWSTYFGGDRVTLRYRLRSSRTFRGPLAWRYSAQRRTLARGQQIVTIHGTAPVEVALRLELPEVRKGIVFNTDLMVQLLDSHGDVAAKHHRTLRLFPLDAFSDRRKWLEDLKIVLYDPPGNTSQVFDEAEIPYSLVGSLSVLQQTGRGLVVIGEGVSLADHANLPDVTTKLAASGIPILCLAPVDGRLELPGGQAEQPIATSITFRRADVITEFDKFLDAEAWPPDGRLAVSGLEMGSYRGRLFLSVVDASPAWPWFEVTYPSGGRLVICGFGIIRSWQAGPTPRYLLVRILEQLSEGGSRLPDETE